jgi:RNA polymerase sigma factor (sigma-70 family)
MDAAARALAVTKVVNDLLRKDRGRLLSALIRRVGDFQVAEDALQEAAISALSHWGRSGLPASPEGWLLQAALRKAIDRFRSSARNRKKIEELALFAGEEASDTPSEEIADERLRLIFTCCHPALERKSQVALTLRTIGGLTTTEIARAFLDAEPTMGQRLSRAKAKIAAAGIPYAVPDEEAWGERLEGVLTVIYLIFNAGYTAGPSPANDLCHEALFLVGLLEQLRPEDPEIEGAHALLALTHARAAARTDADGVTVPLAAQDRSRWDHGAIADGQNRLERALQRRRVGPFQLKAAIAACHCDEPVDWPQIAALYETLFRWEQTPVTLLNHAVACAEAAKSPAVGLAALAPLAADLAEYQPFHAARADFLRRCGRREEAREAYARAISLAQSAADVAFLRARAATLDEL